VVDAAQCSIVLVEPDTFRCEGLAGRLRAQGYRVRATTEPATAATWALATPPDAVVSDLWMPGISGVQLCRLLIAEPSTADVPIILRGEGDDPRNRFFAEKAGAVAYVPHGRIGQLVRTLGRAIEVADRKTEDAFFTHLGGEDVDIRERIAHHLDRSLFESMVTSEVRALGTCENFERLFDLFSQFMAQVTHYRWLALKTLTPARLALHTHPAIEDQALAEASSAFDGGEVSRVIVLDEDAVSLERGGQVQRATVSFGGERLAELAFAPCRDVMENARLLELVAKELGGPIRMAELVQESQRLASYDALTGIMNRRAFVRAAEALVERETSAPQICLLLLDIDHFKQINDTHGHAAGDEVLSAVGGLLREIHRDGDLVARWGGEEFVMALPHTARDIAFDFAERVRSAVESLLITTREGGRIPVTASVGLAVRRGNEELHDVVERADRAMYTAKVGGRNRLEVA